jgi:hypothetical protein
MVSIRHAVLDMPQPVYRRHLAEHYGELDDCDDTTG